MNLVEHLERGHTRCLFSGNSVVTIARIMEWAAVQTDGERVVVCDLDMTQPVYAMPHALVHGLARAALAIWPDWYGGSDEFKTCDEHSLQSVVDRLVIARVAEHQRPVQPSWLVRAVSLCRSGKVPIVPEFSPVIQLQQLALVIAKFEPLLVVHAIPSAAPESAALIGLARALEWLSRHVAARIIAVLPAAWAGRTELDPVSWDARKVDEEEAVESSTGTSLDEPQVMVGPIRGRPHPNSPGEQRLAEHLLRDSTLGPLFAYNMPVTTVRGSRYTVDLLWNDGQVIVEIDGYRNHSSRIDFANDRQRDYELQLSGFLVLRLTHESVMADVELAIDKIRDFVKLRTGHRPSPRNNE